MTFPQITSWSYSGYSDFKNCRAKFWYNKTVPRGSLKGNEAAEKGIAAHEHFEKYLKGETGTLPLEHMAMQPVLDGLRELGAISELAIAINREFQFVDWSSPQAWFRAKLDAVVISPEFEGSSGIVNIYDFKTGKPWNYDTQAVLYTTLGLLRYSNVDTARFHLIYTKEPEKEPQTSATVLRQDLDYWKAKMEKMWKEIETCESFPTNPNTLCKWCTFRKSNGGPCPEEK